MTPIDIERLPELVANGSMSKKEGAYRIWEELYCNPHRFGLTRLNEDEKSDFLLSLLKNFEQALIEFMPGRAQFRTYLCGLLKISYPNWRRKQLTRATAETLTDTMLKAQYDTEAIKYETPQEHTDDKQDINMRPFATPKKRSIAETTALVLTLKNCHNVDETILKNVSRFLHIDADELESLVHTLRKQSEHKIEKRARVIRRRDNAFYYHRKYMSELTRLQEGTASFEKVQEKYLKQTESWIRQNKLLAHRFVLSPTNASIAKEIDMEPRKVSFYIRSAVRNRNPFITKDKDDTQSEPTDEES